MSAPEWLKPGSEVVVITSHPGAAKQTARLTTVRTVAAKSFTVTGFDCRFNLARLAGRTGGDWGSSHEVVPPASEQAHRALIAQRNRNLVNRARIAVEKWLRDGTRDRRLAAIAALEAVEGDS